MNGFNEVFLVGFDYSKGADATSMVVGKRVNNEIEVIRSANGKEAEEMYEKIRGVSLKEIMEALDGKS